MNHSSPLNLCLLIATVVTITAVGSENTASTTTTPLAVDALYTQKIQMPSQNFLAMQLKNTQFAQFAMDTGLCCALNEKQTCAMDIFLTVGNTISDYMLNPNPAFFDVYKLKETYCKIPPAQLQTEIVKILLADQPTLFELLMQQKQVQDDLQSKPMVYPKDIPLIWRGTSSENATDFFEACKQRERDSNNV